MITELRAQIAALELQLGVALLEAGRLDDAREAAAHAAARGLGAMADELRGAIEMAGGDLDAADQAFARAAELAPERAGPLYNRAVVAHRRGDEPAAVASYREALARVPDHLASLEALGALLHAHGDRAGSLAVHERILAIDPAHVAARHLAAAARGDSPPAPPDGYVAASFDGYAPTFEAHLGALGYRAPALIAAALEGSFARALDLGCGTGLAGRALRDRCERLEGVDLSPNMIEAARAKGVYDALAVADAIAFLAAGEGAYDLVIAADVLGYLGDLAPLFAAVARRLAGTFAFTVERNPDPDAWRLAPSARYQHGRAYVERTLATAGLHVTEVEEVELRREAGVPVIGLLIVACHTRCLTDNAP